MESIEKLLNKVFDLSIQLLIAIAIIVIGFKLIKILERKHDWDQKKEEKWVLNHNKLDLSRHLRRTKHRKFGI